uniref:(northern house mosquito) hypothetical protein n=1 Tax=Culex pipiens TaxID=7175 RepID=A0A8D8F8E2_CULPI
MFTRCLSHVFVFSIYLSLFQVFLFALIFLITFLFLLISSVLLFIKKKNVFAVPPSSCRASQIHKVPRKTLRNWMKRWDIKSAYPMPRQLKEAAEKKRIIKELTEQAQQLSDELTTH